jgi:hypothetical protein
MRFRTALLGGLPAIAISNPYSYSYSYGDSAPVCLLESPCIDDIGDTLDVFESEIITTPQCAAFQKLISCGTCPGGSPGAEEFAFIIDEIGNVCDFDDDDGDAGGGFTDDDDINGAAALSTPSGVSTITTIVTYYTIITTMGVF